MDAWVRDLLLKRTGEDLAAWNARVAAQDPRRRGQPASLAGPSQGVTGYPQMLLVMERFGYPDYLRATPDELVEGQYRDRPGLRPIHDALLALLPAIGEVDVQNRKTYVALLTPRRTFASIEPTTKPAWTWACESRGTSPQMAQLVAATSMGQSAVTHRIGLATVQDVDDEVRGWLQRAYDANV